jgi:DNA invertase Pin-like site-specific DNA recombinase
MLEVMEILAIATEKQEHIYSVKGSWNLDNTIQSKLIAMSFSMASEIERDLISSRTKKTLAVIKASGVKLGRPKGIGKSKLDAFRPEIEALLNNGSPKRFVAKRYKVSEAALFNWLRKHKIKAHNN